MGSLFAPEKGQGIKKPDGVKKGKRTLKDITGRIPLPELHRQLVESKGWPYKTFVEEYLRRDRGLVSACVITGGRIKEVLMIERKQVIADPEDGNYWLITNFQVVKRKGGAKDYRVEVALPLEGSKYPWSEFAPFTHLFLDYLKEAPSEGRIFRFGRIRAWQIVEANLGIWCHYLRAVCESHLMRVMKDSVVVGKYMKVNPETLSKYVQAEWRDYR